MSATVLIGPGSRVVVHLALSLADGTEVLSTFGEEPVSCRIGDGTLQPGLELALHGLAAGTREEMLLQAGLAYGERDEGMLQCLEPDSFGDMLPQPGQVIGFSLPNGEETAGQVVEVLPDAVLVDFNHPLAGLPLHLRVEVLEVEA